VSTQAIRLRPTKIEFIKLRRRLAVARRVHRILKERLTILVSELLRHAKGAIVKRTELNEELSKAHLGLLRAWGQIGGMNIAIDTMATQRDVKAEFLSQNIAGVRTPMIKAPSIVRMPGERGLTLLDETTSLQEASEHFEKAAESIIKLAEMEKSMELIGLEVKATRRKVSILEHVIIPRIEETIHYLSMKFEEREREEKIRLKRTKKMLVKRKKT
jgi:V/A-type H+-transporting ATPase subunit D